MINDKKEEAEKLFLQLPSATIWKIHYEEFRHGWSFHFTFKKIVKVYPPDPDEKGGLFYCVISNQKGKSFWNGYGKTIKVAIKMALRRFMKDYREIDDLLLNLNNLQ